MNLTEDKLTKIIKVMLIITLVLTSLYIFSQFSGFISSIRAALSAVLTPFLIAFFINFLIFPIVVYAEDKGLRPRWLIVTFIYLVIFSILGLLFYVLTPLVAQQLQSLVFVRIPGIYENVIKELETLNIQDNELLQNILTSTQTGIKDYILNTVIAITTQVPNIISSIFTVVLTPIILFYVLKDHNQIGEGFYKIVPVKYKEHFVELVKRINATLGLYIRGQIIIMFGIGVIASLGYTLIGLDYALVFGVIVGLTNIIPYIGATLSAIVPVTYALLTGTVPWYTVLLLNLSFQFVEGNILQPVIMSKQLDMHPLVILAAILGFGSLFGVLGVIFAVPLAGLIKVCIIYYNEVKEKKEEEGSLI